MSSVIRQPLSSFYTYSPHFLPNVKGTLSTESHGRFRYRLVAHGDPAAKHGSDIFSPLARSVKTNGCGGGMAGRICGPHTKSPPVARGVVLSKLSAPECTDRRPRFFFADAIVERLARCSAWPAARPPNGFFDAHVRRTRAPS